MMFNHRAFLAIFVAMPVFVYAAGGPPGSGTQIVEVIPNYDDSELTIMGSGLSDGSATPSVELGGFVLNVTSFDANTIVADANLSSFVAGDYLLRVDPNFKTGKSVETLLTLGSDTTLSESEVDAFVSNNGYSTDKVSVSHGVDLNPDLDFTGCVAVSSFTMNAPNSGKFVIQVQAVVQNALFFISTSPADCGAPGNFFAQQGDVIGTIGLTRVFTVSSAGTNTFWLNGYQPAALPELGSAFRTNWVGTFYYQ